MASDGNLLLSEGRRQVAYLYNSQLATKDELSSYTEN